MRTTPEALLSLMRLLEAKGVLDVINRAGAEAFKIASARSRCWCPRSSR